MTFSQFLLNITNLIAWRGSKLCLLRIWSPMSWYHEVEYHSWKEVSEACLGLSYCVGVVWNKIGHWKKLIKKVAGFMGVKVLTTWSLIIIMMLSRMMVKIGNIHKTHKWKYFVLALKIWVQSRIVQTSWSLELSREMISQCASHLYVTGFR